MTKADAPSRGCDYCGLPLGNSLLRSATDEDGAAGHAAAFCCFGCRMAAAITAERGEEGETRWTLTRLGLAIFFTMNVMVFTMALWSRDVYVDEPSLQTATASALYELFRYGCLLFSAPVVLLLGGPILEQAWQSLRRGEITTDWLLSAGVAASLIYSTIAVLTGAPHIYFEVGCMVLVAVTLGRWLEATGKLRTTEAIRSLQRLLPETARVQRQGTIQDVALSQVEIGDQIRVLPGERIPLDGVIVRNSATVDQQLVTGESVPVHVDCGESVFAGSLNLDGDVSIRVTAPASAGTLQRLVELVTEAVHQKGAELRLADRLTRWFVPAIVVITLGTFAHYWYTQSFHDGLMTALAVVLIACPCALAIATPMAIWAALGTACRHQVVFRKGDALSQLATLRAICFDKTGTITRGDIVVERMWLGDGQSHREVLWQAASLAQASNHILAHAIADYASRAAEWDQTAAAPREIQVVPGRGLRGRLASSGPVVYLGSWAFMQESHLAAPAALQTALADCQQQRQSFSCIGWDGQLRGVFAFHETMRAEAKQTIQQLQELGLQVYVLTGDYRQRAELIGEQLGVEVIAELLPEEKLRAIQRIRDRDGSVAMVGDGVNDAPALAAADVGVAMGCGADVSRDAADVCLLGNDLAKLVWALRWSRETRRVVRQNLFWAFAYNSVGVTLAVFQLLNPIVAAIAMVGSSLFVVSNSLRLSRDVSGDFTTSDVVRRQLVAAADEPHSASGRQAVDAVSLDAGSNRDDERPRPAIDAKPCSSVHSAR